MGPLDGIRIIEFAGIGPSPFACMMLADMGAEVIRVERPPTSRAQIFDMGRHDITARNRTVVHLDLKDADGRQTVRDLIAQADGLVEGFRPGVMERLGLGPDDCLSLNPRLVFGRMTGWGQTGERAQTAGHEINYISVNGVLDMVGNAGEKPACPPTLLGDMGGGAMFMVAGMLAALLSAARTGKGQVVDASVVEGSALLAAVPWSMAGLGRWGDRGTNLVDGGPHFYDSYECADGKYLSVGALEPQFQAALWQGFGLADDPDFANSYDPANWPSLKERLATVIKTKTRDEWADHFAGTDACVAPVLTREEAAESNLNAEQEFYVEVDGVRQPAPSPGFSATPTRVRNLNEDNVADAGDILARWSD